MATLRRGALLAIAAGPFLTAMGLFVLLLVAYVKLGFGFWRTDAD